MSKMLPSEKNQESEIEAVSSPISSPPHDHFNNDLQNEESIISESAKDKVVVEIEDQKATEKGKLPASELYELNHVCPKIGEKRKCPMPEFYELKHINKPTFFKLEKGETSENKLEMEDNYDYHQDLAILKAIYHYFFNHGVIPYPNYTKNFINYIEASIPNLKFRGQALVTKIDKLEYEFLTIIMKTTAGHYPDIIHPIFREIFYLSMGLWGNPRDNYPVDNQFLDEENRNQEKLQAVKKGKRPMSELYELKHIVPTFSNLGLGAGTSENELQEDDYGYDQDLAILRSMYQYYFNHGGIIPYPRSKKLINYIEALVPNLKVRGQALETKIVMIKNDFLAVMKMAGGFDPDKVHPVYREIFCLSMGLWG